MAYPGVEHLFGLKSAIYKTPYKNEPQDTAIEDFAILSHEELRYSIDLPDTESVRALFMMTPYAYRTGREDRERVLALSSITTDVDFHITVYEKL